jgi:glycosyltransferase involved in cell wall biosynthesis
MAGLALSMANPLRVSIVIPVAGGGDRLRRCLASVDAAEPAADEVIVVADGCAESAEIARSGGARVVSLDARSGPAQARNVGAAAASGDVLFFLDADVEIAIDAVEQVRSTFDAEPSLDALFGSYDDAPAEPNFLSQYKNLLHHYVHQRGRENASTFWAGCGAVRRAVFASRGGFDERYDRPSIEDIELGYRLRAAGHRIALRKDLRVKHLKRWTVASLLRSDIFDRALPWTDLVWQRGLVDDLNLRISERASGVLALVLAVALVIGVRRTGALLVGVAAAVVLIALNRDLYRFFWRTRGARFATGAVAWHWLYFVYSTIAFAIGSFRSMFRSSPRRAGAGPSRS